MIPIENFTPDDDEIPTGPYIYVGYLSAGNIEDETGVYECQTCFALVRDMLRHTSAAHGSLGNAEVTS